MGDKYTLLDGDKLKTLRCGETISFDAGQVWGLKIDLFSLSTIDISADAIVNPINPVYTLGCPSFLEWPGLNKRIYKGVEINNDERFLVWSIDAVTDYAGRGGARWLHDGWQPLPEPFLRVEAKSLKRDIYAEFTIGSGSVSDIERVFSHTKRQKSQRD